MKETKTIQLYPDDNVINDAVALYENFGWEVVSNQRCQELTDGGRKTSTFNKLTLSRDKDAKWYREAKAFEDEYDKTLDEISGLRGQKRTPKEPFKPCKPEFGLPIIAFIFCLIPPLTLIDIFFVIMYAKHKSEYKKDLAEYEANIKRYETVDKPEAEKLNRELDDRIAAKETRLAEIRTAADNAINA